jgi:hypothetical protein
MKTLLFVALLVVTTSVYSQTDSTNFYLHRAGENLALFNKASTNGMFIQITGTMIMASTLLLPNDMVSQKDILTLGAAVTFTGFVVNYFAYRHLRRASNCFLKIQPASTGVGVAFKL